MLNRFLDLKRQRKVLLMLLADAILLPLAFWSAYALRLGGIEFENPSAPWVYFLAPAFAIPVFVKMGLYRAIVRYMDDRVVWVVFSGVSISVLLILATAHFLGLFVPRTAYLIYWGIATIYVGGSRFLARGVIMGQTSAIRTRTPVVIYGAGETGAQVALALRAGKEYHVVGFVDDDRERQQTVVAGILVHPADRLPYLLDRFAVKAVLIAMPEASRAHRNAIMARLEGMHVRLLTVPGIAEIVSGAVRIDDIREVDIEDLLGRDVVAPDAMLLAANVRGRAVLVTGAGGSIGSELCRQILLQRPRHLVLLELSEYALYAIDQELQAEAVRLGVAVEISPLLGSVLDRVRMEQVMRLFDIQTVYHAAAYKHVPMVEFSPVEGIRNNAFGTWRCAEAAIATGVRNFVLISTDKAVRPTNVMGASKRLAELVLQALAVEHPQTCFSMVRFGNVLGSSGSVVPLFRSQLKAGGPITLTHPEITRYFMTIPEASQLVIQAGAMAKGGDVFVLDMGQPVKIIDLARRMIHLSGLEVRDEQHPDGDIEIRLTGLRPGEKLYEELLIGDNVTGTTHPLIMRAEEESLPWPELGRRLSAIEAACASFDLPALQELMLQTVRGYQPTSGIGDLAWARSAAAGASRGADRALGNPPA